MMEIKFLCLWANWRGDLAGPYKKGDGLPGVLARLNLAMIALAMRGLAFWE